LLIFGSKIVSAKIGEAMEPDKPDKPEKENNGKEQNNN